jgi:NAD(P)-dependent dehydrogenase (short-subunit alcohol dehydrogenase family)
VKSKPQTKNAMEQKNKKPQTAIVTGASSGIGLGITRALLERGYQVVANSCTIHKSKKLRASKPLVLVAGDISKKDTAVKVADAAIKH